MKNLLLFSLPLFLFIQCKSTKSIENQVDSQKEKTEIMDLYKTAWVWRYTQHNEKRTEPREKDKFTIRFDKERIDIKTDCNGMSATYQMEDNKIKLTDFISTRMYCADSQESIFSHQLQLADSYEISKKENQLKFILNDQSIMVFENLNQ